MPRTSRFATRDRLMTPSLLAQRRGIAATSRRLFQPSRRITQRVYAKGRQDSVGLVFCLLCVLITMLSAHDTLSFRTLLVDRLLERARHLQG